MGKYDAICHEINWKKKMKMKVNVRGYAYEIGERGGVLL